MYAVLKIGLINHQLHAGTAFTVDAQAFSGLYGSKSFIETQQDRPSYVI